MDPRIGGNGIQFRNQGSNVLPDTKALDNPSVFENACSVYDPVNGVNACQNLDSVSVYDRNFRGIQFDRSFRGIQFDSTTSSSSPVVSSSLDDELHEDCDLSDAILGYISQVLMEEDMEDKSCMLYESLDLQAAEKSFYDVLGKKYPPSPSYAEGSFSVDRYIESPSDYSSLDHNTYVGEFSNSSDYLHHESNLQGLGANDTSCRSLSSSNSGNNAVDGFIDSPTSTFQESEICDENQMMLKFKKGVEEANKFLPSDNKLLASFNGGGSWPKVQNSKDGELKVMVDGRNLQTGTRVRKSPYGEDDEERSIKQAAIFQESTLRSKEIDLIFLCSQGQGDVALRSLRNTLREETSKDKLKDKEPKSLSKGKSKGRSRRQKNTKEVIDLRTLLITCAQAIAADDQRNANELLKQIKQHASPFGDGSQRLAHCFANGLEARLAGTGSQIYRALVSKKTSSADYIKAYYLYIASSPFRKISNFASNRTIKDMALAENATRIHIIDFGILYGFQWPTFIQRISEKKGGPPRLRLTGIEFPQPGFRPAERIEETGLRLKEYANQFNVPFEYNPIAKRWEDVSVEDLKIDEGEFLVVNCMYRSKNLLDEIVGVDSARNMVLNLIKKIRPDIFIHGILNGSYNAPFFVTRFREALFHFSALFDMLETNVPPERSERMLLERDLFGREALNVIACEGWERVERPETYKQWHARNLRAGFVSFPFSRAIIKMAEEKVGLYHKDFMIDVDNQWLLLGWKGRIIYAISCWKAE